MKTITKLLTGAFIALGLAAPGPASKAWAQDAQTPFIGQIEFFAGNFAPRGWAFCDGQLLSIASNDALFSLLGTMYGGDGRTTFGLPDMRGRVMRHAGSGPGLTPVRQGPGSGRVDVALNQTNLPAHNHSGHIVANSGNANVAVVDGAALAGTGGENRYRSAGSPNSNMKDGGATLQNTGGSQQFGIQNPYVGIRCIIALVGIYPSRN